MPKKKKSKGSKAPNARGLTVKQQKYAEELVKTGDPQVALDNAGYQAGHPETRSTQIRRLRNHDKVQEYIQFLLAKKDVPQKITSVVVEAMDATETFQGTDTGNPNHMVRLKAADQAAKLLGINSTTQNLSLQKHEHFHFGDLPKEVLEYVHKHGKLPDLETYTELTSRVEDLT